MVRDCWPVGLINYCLERGLSPSASGKICHIFYNRFRCWLWPYSVAGHGRFAEPVAIGGVFCLCRFWFGFCAHHRWFAGFDFSPWSPGAGLAGHEPMAILLVVPRRTGSGFVFCAYGIIGALLAMARAGFAGTNFWGNGLGEHYYGVVDGVFYGDDLCLP